MILAVANTKGGVGKTTVAANLAIARAVSGRDVILIDGDEGQSSAARYMEARHATGRQPMVTTVAIAGAQLRAQAAKLAPRFDDVVIDVGGRDTSSLRAALVVADVALIPVPPRSLELWALRNVCTLICESRVYNPTLRGVAFLNLADTAGTDNEGALELIRAETELEVLDERLSRRKAFSNAAVEGLSVIELHPIDRKAADELDALERRLFAVQALRSSVPA